MAKKMIPKRKDRKFNKKLNLRESSKKSRIREYPFKQPSLMSELQKISIDAPEDFSVQVAMKLWRNVSEDKNFC